MSSLSITASTIAARLASGDLKAATPAEILTLLGITESEFSVLDQDSTDVTVGSTTTETSLYSFSVPADTLGTNKLLHLRMTGTFLNTRSGTEEETVRFKYGSTTIFTGVRDAALENTVTAFSADFYLVGDGGTSAQRGWGHLTWSGGAVRMLSGFGTATEDSTSALTLDVTFQHEVANSGVIIVHKYSHLTLDG